EELEWFKTEYSAHEQIVFGKIKEGVVMAIMHPGIAAGSATLAGIILFKRPRSYLIQRVRHMFVSKETLLSGVQAEIIEPFVTFLFLYISVLSFVLLVAPDMDTMCLRMNFVKQHATHLLQNWMASSF
ncbi:hypothetical protein ACJX0J_022938, partial [Zea mays]